MLQLNDNSLQLDSSFEPNVHGKIRTRLKEDCAEIYEGYAEAIQLHLGHLQRLESLSNGYILKPTSHSQICIYK